MYKEVCGKGTTKGWDIVWIELCWVREEAALELKCDSAMEKGKIKLPVLCVLWLCMELWDWCPREVDWLWYLSFVSVQEGVGLR